MRIRSAAASSCLLVLVVAGACRQAAGPGPGLRLSDGLLSEPRLQEVVALQAERNGPALVALLAAPEPEVRARAAFALASVQDPGAVPALVAALRDAEARVREDVAFALGQSGDPSAVAPLAERFASETDARVRLAILDALGRIPDPGAPAALLSLDAREAEELERVRALARVGGAKRMVSPEAQEHLLARLDHADPAMRAAAAYFFGRYPDPGPWAAWADRVRGVLAGYGYDDPAAVYLVQALGRLGDPVDGGPLRSWAASGRDWRTRANAVTALGSLPPDPTNRDVILGALDDPSPLVAVAAAQALGRGGAVPAELERMKAWIGTHPDRAQAAGPLLGVLARAGERSFVFAWLDALAPEDAFNWGAGLQALASLPGDDVLERLERAAAASDPRIQAAALDVLRRRWEEERAFAGQAERYFRIFDRVAREGSPRAAAAAAESLADPLLAALAASATSPVGDTARAAPRRWEMDWADLASLGPRPRLRLETERGPVVVRLVPEEAPFTVQAITRLARDGAYDGTPFHRVVPNFVAQGGDVAAGDGSGEAEFTLPSEFTRLLFREGVVGMASSGKDTEGSQLFVTHSAQPHLDGAYTAFGWVEEGMDVVARLLVGDRIVRATVERTR